MKNNNKNRVKTDVQNHSTRWFRRILPILLGMVISLNLLAQKTAISGVVVDSKNEPVIGANIIIKGTKTATITDYDGKFNIQAKTGD